MYYLKQGWRGMRARPLLTALMCLGIGLGTAAAMTITNMLALMSNNPMAHKNDRLYAVQLDNWSPNQPFAEPNEPPNKLSYQDVNNLLDASAAPRQAAMFHNSFPIQPSDPDVAPFLANTRLTTADFFAMFDVPFQAGAAWDTTADAENARVAVLSAPMAQRLFGTTDAVGQTVTIENSVLTVIGVLAEWQPRPRFYDVSGGVWADTADFFLPISFGFEKGRRSDSSMRCWESPDGRDYDAWLRSECVWIDFWVEVDGTQGASAYLEFLNNYVQTQKAQGRFVRPSNNRLVNVEDWLIARGVVDDDTRTRAFLAYAFLLVCLVNTIGLLLAKFMARGGEISLRRALGASRIAILKQFLVEAAQIGLVGGAVAVALTALGLAGIRKLQPNLADVTAMTGSTIALCFCVAVATAVLAGLLPTWRASRTLPATQLKTQ